MVQASLLPFSFSSLSIFARRYTLFEPNDWGFEQHAL